ncbi:alpha/beta fold hydrolase [Pseudoroseomonas wenyumeiae]|uniref:Alpha/beta fold hydrolase n=1 Tax=Teichococcus wenyumeiae TaxID=2478470 RepID=A0A3A9JKX4_9PROT|nr:alpha/beta hydrolase [Pseudoroseomonas wenyumeiae]RKK04456.1 alpha/beta hydrolase [Pseudoroseomonas wenyumeiae]RMI25690.1 alpha/beta fold hydrolase [Pseudoroseomonas wenyumeiae]
MSEPRIGALRVRLPFGPVELRWAEWGPPDGVPVVCVHGLTRTGRDFDTLARELAEDGRRVICPDIPGRGLSSWLPDGNLYAVPTYLAALGPLLQELGSYDWVGTSMGGLIGMGLASIPGNSLRRMVLNDVGAAIPAAALIGIGAYLGSEPEFADVAAVEAHLRAIHAGFGPLSPAEWRHLAETSARMMPNGRVVLHYDPAIAVPMRGAPPADVVLWPLWETLKLPVLLLRGAESPLLTAETAERMASRPGVTLVTVPGCGHAPALMDPSQTGVIRGFLRG